MGLIVARVKGARDAVPAYLPQMARRPRPIRPLVRDSLSYERRLRREWFNPLLERLKTEVERRDTIAGILRALENVLGPTEERAEITGAPVEIIEAELLGIEAHQRARMISGYKATFAVDIAPVLVDPPVQFYMGQQIGRNVDLVRTIPRRLHADLRSRLTEELAGAPFDRQRLNRIFRDEFKSSGYNLRRIVRDQNSKTVAGAEPNPPATDRGHALRVV